MKNDTHEFYIGWQPNAPGSISRRIKQVIIALNFLVPVIGILIVMHQRGFTDSRFEYGVTTEVTGILMKTPAPFVQLSRGKNLNGEQLYQYVLLVAPGKHGVQEMLTAREAELGHSLEGRKVALKGFLIYHDGKTLLEVEEISEITELSSSPEALVAPEPFGEGAIIGEITDPKCYFGVMKPGYGKPHRSCAARCIAGGIPPVLKAETSEGHIYYYILAGADGMPINEQVVPFAGDQVAVCGDVRKIGDWLVLYKDAEKDIQLIDDRISIEMALCR